ncbi:TetR/AcrR family transcriptional regulator [Leptospira gomenensis]|uniref:TetR/AcrR family transcriptional regulator n=1 Tax=Leptospira gomenensis TaxID=2484974 RepID=A0A5F1YA20_9LEPT|nr:TetR/AcrR family transcriptional regulator [Leptospira gomenensis]TGK33266.1 TetR/AcrR family transcriptional regulator [Leptospira gomenensis]TGK45140.1 TetR/AcrR family transcriptional regulator [Leptospira gomenensis]TGK50926.1 TetR/AcrR family transcriptional regulator [Leptospira gomenensis]TGK56549.1 TetR/AcrR family transcriptional regulator [Leptospira gomenensis]
MSKTAKTSAETNEPGKKYFPGFGAYYPTSGKESKKSQETKNKLLESTLLVFGNKGFHEARVEDITAQAGFAKGTFYEHFKSKDDLIYILIDYAARKDLEIAKSLFARCTSSVDIRENFLKPILHEIESKKELSRVCYQFLTNEIMTKDKLKSKIEYYNRLYHRYHLKMIRIGQNRNYLSKDFDREEIFVLFRYMTDGFGINQAYSLIHTRKPEIQIDSVLKLFDRSLLVVS